MLRRTRVTVLYRPVGQREYQLVAPVNQSSINQGDQLPIGGLSEAQTRLKIEGITRPLSECKHPELRL